MIFSPVIAAAGRNDNVTAGNESNGTNPLIIPRDDIEIFGWASENIGFSKRTRKKQHVEQR